MSQSGSQRRFVAGWLVTEEETSSRALYTCLELVPKLVCAIIDMPAGPSEAKGRSRSDAERFGYNALSALICAIQIRTAWALHNTCANNVCKAESFLSFWQSAVSRSDTPVFVLHTSLVLIFKAHCCLADMLSAHIPERGRHLVAHHSALFVF